MRVRENDEQIALLKGEQAEAQGLTRRFANVVANWFDYMKYTKRLTWFTSFVNQASIIFPFVLLAPAYFSGAVQLGSLTQTAGAFGRVEAALMIFTNLYASLADYKSVIDRLTGFVRSADTARETPPAAIAGAKDGEALRLSNLTVTCPTARRWSPPPTSPSGPASASSSPAPPARASPPCSGRSPASGRMAPAR